MRVVILTNGNFFSTVCMKPLLMSHPDWVHCVYVTTGLRRQKGNRALEALGLAQRYGWRYFSYKAFTYAWFQAAERLLPVSAYTALRVCDRLGIPTRKVRNVNAGDVAAEIVAMRPDLLVSISVPYRIREPVLGCASALAVNCHSSLLPAYAGVCTYVWALANNEARTGMTIHRLVERFDAGDIVAQETIPIEPGMSVFGLFYRQVRLGGRLLLQIAESAAEGSIRSWPQDSLQGSYFGEPAKEAIAALRSHGFSLLRLKELIAATRDERF